MYYVLIKLCSCFDGVCIITPPMFSVLWMMCTCKHMNVVIRVVSLLSNIKEMWYTCLVFCIPMDYTDIRAFTNNLTSGCNEYYVDLAMYQTDLKICTSSNVFSNTTCVL